MTRQPAPAVPDAAARRFAHDCAAAGLADDARLGLAVSGGPDSMAMLLLAHAALPERIVAASVDHGLRPEAAEECAIVARTCARLGVPHDTLRVSVAADGNRQANARTARYAALGAWLADGGAATLATAHHGDDQAETLLMRLARASASRGLAGMRARATLPGHRDRALIRPLLGWRREELAAIVEAAGVAAAQDPSNADGTYLRVRIRQWLADAPEGIAAERLAMSAAHLADDADALDWAAAKEWDERVAHQGDALTYRPAGPRAIRLRVLARILDAMGTEGSARGDSLARLLESLESGLVATLGGLRCAPDGEIWRFVAAPPRREP